jgi:predicted transcriptional regulator
VNWNEQLAQAEDALVKGELSRAYRDAFGALEICFDAVLQAKIEESVVRDERFKLTVRALADRRLLSPDERQLALHLADARNVVVHKYGFEPSSSEVRKTIERVARLCGKFAKRVHEVMVKPVLTAGPQEPVGQFITPIVDDGFSQIPVVDGQKVIGTLTDKSVLKAWERGGGILDLQTPVRDLMIGDLIPEIRPDATIEEAKIRMIGHKAKALLVLNKRLPVGILTEFDLLKHLGV